ncbi:Testican-3, partial [Harpegnathos saltator]
CQECPVVKPTFLCGSDNRTYSSPCRLEYHNCIHHTSVHIACKGFCPCKGTDLRTYTKKMQMQRKKGLMGKMGRNHDITLTPRDFNYDNHHYQYLKYSKRGKVSLARPCSSSRLSRKLPRRKYRASERRGILGLRAAFDGS